MVNDVLMSIHPVYVEAILAGTKTVELRRRRPSFAAGTRILVYSTSPNQRVDGVFDVAGVIEATPTSLWEQVADRAGVDRDTFDAYLAGAEKGYAIEIENPQRVVPTSLPMRPPQSYQFLRPHRAKHRALLRLAQASAT